MRFLLDRRLPQFLDQITTPAPFDNPIKQYQARLLAGIALAMILVEIPIVLIQFINAPFNLLTLVTIVGAGVLVPVYRLSRTERYADGANLLVMSAFVGCFIVILFYWNPAVLALIFIPILLAGLFWSFRATVIITVVVHVAALYLIVDRVTVQDEALFLSLFLTIVCVLVLVVARSRQHFERMVIQLQQSEDRYRTASQDSLDAFYLMESIRDGNNAIVDFRITEVNAVAEKRSGITRKQMVGSRLRELFPESGPRGIFQKFKQVVDTKQGIIEEYYTPSSRTGSGWYYQQVVPVGDGIAITSRDIGARKRSEADLHESEQRFRELAESSPDVIMIVDVKSTKPIYINRDEFLAVDMKIFKEEGSLLASVHPDDQKQTQFAARAFLKGDMRYNIMEYRVQNTDGGWDWVQSRKTILARDDDGLPHRILATLSVITERKNAEVELRESEARFRNLFDQASEAIILHDTFGQVVDVNQEACRNLGYTYDELIAMNIADFDDHWRDNLMNSSGQYTGDDLPAITEAVHHRKNGETFPVEIRASWFEHYDERKLIIAYVRDISARKQSEYDLRESEERYRSLYEGSINPVMLFDRDGTILMLNQVAAQSLGKPVSECVGHKLHEFVPEFEDRLLQRVQHVFQTNQAMHVEDEIKASDGSTHWFWSSVQPVMAGDGTVYAAQFISYDITEQKLAERSQIELALERDRTQLLRQVIDIVSHDLMTPITTMNTSLYLLQRTATDERQGNRVAIMQDQLDSMAKMVQDMLLLMKLEAPGRYSFEFGEGQLEPVIEGIVTTFQETAQGNDINLKIDAPSSLPPVTFDRKMLAQVMSNLVDNAIKFSDSGGQVTVSLQPKDEWLCIEVEDKGRGIEAGQLSLIFESLYKGDKHRPANSGSGIGLSIAKHIVDAHNGTIEVESEVGEGTTFRINLPLTREVEAAQE